MPGPDQSSSTLFPPEAEASRYVTELGAALSARRDRWVEVLGELVAIPSVGFAGRDGAPLEASARAVADQLDALGLFSEVRVVTAPGADGAPSRPAVVARRDAAPGFPTVLLYAHHDVQPATAAGWTGAPFRAEVRDGRVYGRGAGDDKGGIVAHLAALAAVRDVLGEPGLRVGVTVLIEGEEEFGSPNFAAVLGENAATVAADAAIVQDASNWDEHTPAVTVAGRGVAWLDVEVSTLRAPYHSGAGGGVLPDAFTALARLVASLHHEDGSLAVKGLKIADLELPDGGPGEDDLDSRFGLLDGVRSLGAGPVLERIWAQTSVSVLGVDGPSIAESSNTIVPRARARLSARVSPAQPPEEVLAAVVEHLHEHAPWGVHVEIGNARTADSYWVRDTGWANGLYDEALTRVWRREPVKVGAGGTLPFVASLQREFPGIQLIITGVTDPATRQHGIDESLGLDVWGRSVLSEALFLTAVSQRWPDARG